MQLIFLLVLFQPLVVVTFYIAGTTSLTKKHFFLVFYFLTDILKVITIG